MSLLIISSSITGKIYIIYIHIYTHKSKVKKESKIYDFLAKLR